MLSVIWLKMYQRQLLCNPAGPNEAVQLELPRAWEPLDSSCSSQFGEDESAPDPVLE
jgi:hypothetical protein